MSNDTNQQLVSAAICLECGTLLLSYHVHDFKTCDCPNNAMNDGGSEYSRYGAKDLTKVKITCYNIKTGMLEDNSKPNFKSEIKSRWQY